MEGYVSFAAYGIDAKKFYDEFEVSIQGTSRATGISRASVTRMVAEHASPQNTQKIIWYLEEVSIEDYNRSIEQCRKELKDILMKANAAWQAYQKKEAILNKYRVKYKIARKMEMASQVTAWNLLRCLKER